MKITALWLDTSTNTYKLGIEIKGKTHVSKVRSIKLLYVGLALRYVRLCRNLSQQDVSELLGFKSYTTVGKIELGRYNLTVEQIYTFAEQLNIGVDKILGMADEFAWKQFFDFKKWEEYFDTAKLIGKQFKGKVCPYPTVAKAATLIILDKEDPSCHN